MSGDIERTLLVKPEVFVYKIPPRSSARGYRAADWKLTEPDWTGRMRCVALGATVTIKLEDKGSGELFAACPVDKYPGTAVEAVTDSSRYFVICVQDAGSGRKAYLGMGFSDRSDSFDLNVALQDHFKWVKKEDAFSKEELSEQPKLDLAFKEGQTIKINIPKKEGAAAGVQRARPAGSASGGILPPPPAAAPGPANLTPLQSPTDGTADLLGGLSSPSAASAPSAAPVAASSSSDDPWGDFASSSGSTTNSSGNWVQF